jgi:hypothetical protein
MLVAQGQERIEKVAPVVQQMHGSLTAAMTRVRLKRARKSRNARARLPGLKDLSV